MCIRDSLEISSRSACVFPMMVKAASVLLSRRWAKSSCRRSRAISACSAVGRPTLAPADLPARTPPSRSRRHSVIWEEYSPCWRRYAPPWPWVRAASYAARCSSFCAGVNDRRRVGPPKRGCEGSIRPSWGTGVSVEELIRNQSESRPAWDGLAVNRWPQLTLARRAITTGTQGPGHSSSCRQIQDPAEGTKFVDQVVPCSGRELEAVSASPTVARTDHRVQPNCFRLAVERANAHLVPSVLVQCIDHRSRGCRGQRGPGHWPGWGRSCRNFPSPARMGVRARRGELVWRCAFASPARGILVAFDITELE